MSTKSLVSFNTTKGRRRPGLPDDIFLDQKSQFGKTLEGLAMEGVVIFYGH
jgi:hypothetical protein